MAKKKKPFAADIIPDLLELAKQCNLPDGAFDGDIDDECEWAARIEAEKIKKSPLVEQLEFLYVAGYKIDRLRELIQLYGLTESEE